MISWKVYLAILLVAITLVFIFLGYAELVIIIIISTIVFYALTKSK